MNPPYKIPESVLVVVYTPDLEVLLIRRADTEPQPPSGGGSGQADEAEPFWQSVTGSKDWPEEDWAHTAAREVWEETGLDCRAGGPLAAGLHDWGLQNVYDIYPRWRHRYAPGVQRNTERLFGLRLPERLPITLNPREHTAYVWLPYAQAAQRCFSPSNAEACLWLPRLSALPQTQWA